MQGSRNRLSRASRHLAVSTVTHNTWAQIESTIPLFLISITNRLFSLKLAFAARLHVFHVTYVFISKQRTKDRVRNSVFISLTSIEMRNEGNREIEEPSDPGFERINNRRYAIMIIMINRVVYNA